jgi:hypothetical protein
VLRLPLRPGPARPAGELESAASRRVQHLNQHSAAPGGGARPGILGSQLRSSHAPESHLHHLSPRGRRSDGAGTGPPGAGQTPLGTGREAVPRLPQRSAPQPAARPPLASGGLTARVGSRDFPAWREMGIPKSPYGRLWVGSRHK